MHAISTESMLRTETKTYGDEWQTSRKSRSREERKAFIFRFVISALNSEKFPFVRQSPSGINNDFMIVFFAF